MTSPEQNMFKWMRQIDKLPDSIRNNQGLKSVDDFLRAIKSRWINPPEEYVVLGDGRYKLIFYDINYEEVCYGLDVSEEEAQELLLNL